MNNPPPHRIRLDLTTYDSQKPVINWHPPPVSDTERRLPRVTRTILLQLRSGWSNTLNNCRARIIPGTSDSCPSRNQVPRDAVHIFNYPVKPTALQPRPVAEPHHNSGLPRTSDNIHTQLQRIIIISTHRKNRHTTILNK